MGNALPHGNSDTVILPCIFVTPMSAESFPPSFRLLLSSLVPFNMSKYLLAEAPEAEGKLGFLTLSLFVHRFLFADYYLKRAES